MQKFLNQYTSTVNLMFYKRGKLERNWMWFQYSKMSN